MKRNVAFVALAIASIAGSAAAGIKDMNVQGLDIDALTLPVDNIWNGSYGHKEVADPAKDFGFLMLDSGDVSDHLWIRETWTNEHEPSAILGVDIFSQGRSDPVITIDKSVDNFTTSPWTGFDIVLSTLNGNIDLIGTPTATKYANSQVFNNKSGMVTMSFDMGVVNPGETVDFHFSFSIPMSGMWTFTITQTPVPAPASLALLGVAGVTATRRRRVA